MGFFVWFLFFLCTRHSRKESKLRNQNFFVSVIYFTVFLLRKILDFVITELEHPIKFHSDVATLFVRLEWDMLANKNIYVQKKPLGGIHSNRCC